MRFSALGASGCLRSKFDLCNADPPDPECAALDAGRDAGIDAATEDGGTGDTGPVDAGTDAASTDTGAGNG